MNIVTVFDQLKNASGSNEKISIMKSLSGEIESLFKRICFLAYDPSIDFYLKKFDTIKDEAPSLTLSHALDILESEIASRKYTGNAALDIVEDLYSTLSPGEDEIFYNVIQRDLRIGISAKTINKVWNNLIYIHPYMRCSSFSEKNLANISFPCISQTKMDGMYCDIICNDSVIVMSRNGQKSKINLSNDIKDQLLKQFNGYVVQGELLALDENGQYMERSLGNGYLNSDDIDINRVQFIAWDIVSYDCFTKGIDKTPYDIRYKTLEHAIAMSETNKPFVRLVDTKICYSVDEVIDHFKSKRIANEEGTVIKDMKAIWKDGTSKQQVKVKVIMDCDLKITGFKEGTGKNTGRLGSIECESSDGLLKVSVGTGFKDEERESIWKNRDNLIGKIIAVKANDCIKSQNDDSNWTLFLPRAVEIRTDKTKSDSLERIQEQVKSFTDALKLLEK